MKKKFVIITIIAVLFLSPLLIISKLNDAGNLPKYQQKIWSKTFNVFMELPDILKSSFMIFSGKRSFSNLFNDYNVKFLPETQYIELKFNKKKLNFKKNSRFPFYIEFIDNNFIAITKEGDIYKSKLEGILSEDEKLNMNKVSTSNLFNKGEKNVKILDSLIIDNYIYLTKSYELQNCKKLEIIFAEIKDKLEFKSFKKFKECAVENLGAGRIQAFNFNGNDGILLSTTDSDNDKPGNKAQDDNSIFGKIVFIDFNNRQHNNFSKGHRNVQGLFVLNETILSTEHGPRGGDEINKIIFGKNYGWPIASYGYSYDRKDLIYKKSHEENNFEEPLFVFLPSIGISEVIILPDNFEQKWKNSALVSSLNGRSIYRVKFQNDKYEKVLYTEKIYIGERIRDIKYIEPINSIILALERTGSVGILKKLN